MDYGSILTNAWNIIWKKKFLFVVGILSVMGANAGLGGLSFIVNPSQLTRSLELYGEMGRGPGFGPDEIQMANTAIMITGIAFLAIGIALWFNARISVGGLIAGVGRKGEGEVTGFKAAWMAGWERRWPMFGLGLLILVPTWVFTAPMQFLNATLQQRQMEITTNPSALGPDYFYPFLGVCGLACGLMLVMIPLYLFQMLAERACVLETLTFSGAIRRAWQIVRQKVGEIVLLFLIQIGIAIGIGVIAGVLYCMVSACLTFSMMMLSPWTMLLLLIFVPIVFIASAAIQTYFSAIWTLAWSEWAAVMPSSGSTIEAPAAAE
jgi:hypothetical protein